MRGQKQTKLNYWLATSAIPTSNSFKELDTEISVISQSRPARLPPLFIDGASNI